jgi:hypothetical protein
MVEVDESVDVRFDHHWIQELKRLGAAVLGGEPLSRVHQDRWVRLDPRRNSSGMYPWRYCEVMYPMYQSQTLVQVEQGGSHCLKLHVDGFASLARGMPISTCFSGPVPK